MITFEVQGDEMLTILHNCSTINNSLIPVCEAAQKCDMNETLKQMDRSMELIQQAIKSTHSIVHQIRVRNFPEDELPTVPL